MTLPRYPNFSPISFDYGEALRRALVDARDGVSEFTFANLYLFRKRYGYQVSFVDEHTLVISGERDGKRFFSTPKAVRVEILRELLGSHAYWKNIPASVLSEIESLRGELGVEISEDRDNFDYLYLREDLALLSGKKYHKKRNLVNAFSLAYPGHSEAPLTSELVGDAIAVLERWRKDKREDGDYTASREALELFAELSMEGMVFYVEDRPAGFCLGEGVAGGRIFALHFEKAAEEYKGIYQYINQKYAEKLDENYTFINREQDLGDEGLRQAKMTYRPCGFVLKYIGRRPE
ncbi:MAG: phosphatidylglycerol lysyltransferase domain-containing protein [Spirochaetaceae bacterium]|nr:phosphatidylglycerol lysyltransferase domain-containing protein [Spirochaetaceae bacterium]